MIEEEFGGVRAIVKRELFYGIQQGGRIDPKTVRLIKAGECHQRCHQKVN